MTISRELARRQRIRDGAVVEPGDLIGWGYLGLADARAHRNGNAATWCAYRDLRIRGAIQDGLRALYGRWLARPVATDPEVLDQAHASTSGRDAWADRREFRRLVGQLCDRATLTRRERMIVLLRVVRELTIGAVAQRVGMSEATVWATMRRLRSEVPRSKVPVPNGAKTTPEQVREIRARVAGGETKQAVARRFGMSRQNVANIAARRRWAWVP